MKASNWIDRASLRCADWRFLLPNPPGGEFLHLVVLGGSADLAERLIAAGLAHHLSWEIPTRRMADGVVILHNVRTAQLGDIAGCLLPGGALYLEVDRRSLSSLTSTPGRLWRALVRVGLSPTGIYYVSPDFNHRQMYLPLDVPGAFKWYLRTQVVAGTLGRRVRELVLKMLARLRSLPLAALAPCYAVTAVAGPARDARPSVLGHPALPPEFRRSDLHPLVLTPGQSDSNRVVVLPFAPDSDQPVGVLKLSRLSDRNELTENEQLMLMTIRTRLDQAMRQTIPQPLGIFQWNHLSVGVERCASGCLLAASLGRWGAPLRRKIDDLHLATAWLAEFHCQTLIKRSAWGRAEVREWVETPLTAYTDAFDVTASEKRLFNWTQTRADSLVGIPLPTVWVHWGFNRQNLLRADDRISTIDWEGGSAGPPLFDLVYFVTQWNCTVRRLYTEAARCRAFGQLFCHSEPPDQISAAVHKAIAHYVMKLDIDRRFFPLLLTLVWIWRALGRLNRQPGLGEPGERARSGNQYIGYIAVLAEHVEQLFMPTYETS